MFWKKIGLLLLIIPLVSSTLQAQQEGSGGRQIFSIYFGGGSWYIDAEQSVELSQWLEGFPDIKNYSISIHGHTDDIGSVAYNQMLARRRCQATLRKLLEEGIPRDIIHIEEFGENNPVYDNATWEGKLKNRRVDVIIRPMVM